MTEPIPAIHHVTAIASDPQRNLDFYTRLLGLRLLKTTVNFDDPGTYHLYFGDRLGRPGTILTFFPWPGARRGTPGSGQVTAAAFSTGPDSLGFWRDRLGTHGVAFDEERRFEEDLLRLRDPDGLPIEIVAVAESAPTAIWEGSDVPAGHALSAFHSVTLTERDLKPTRDLLTGTMGFEASASDGARHRFLLPAGEAANRLDVVVRPEAPPGRVAAGSIHHVAWRVPSDEAQAEWREHLTEAGAFVTPVQDRQYFHSIYFREPGGVLFEIATDPPGFTLDETEESLGSSLELPPWLEPHRRRIEESLPEIETKERRWASP